MRNGKWRDVLLSRHTIIALVVALCGALVAVGIGVLIYFSPDEQDLSYHSMHVDATMQTNGDLRIVQTVDIKMVDRDKPWRQLFQTYSVGEQGPTAITDISVKNLDTGEVYAQGDATLPSDANAGQWDTQFARHWYIADAQSRAPYTAQANTQSSAQSSMQTQSSDESGTQSGADSGRLELGWNIPTTTESQSMRFEIAMTWHGAATAYRDVTAMLWEPISAENTVPIGVMTGTFHFPSGSTAHNTWGWLHFTGTSQTSREQKSASGVTQGQVAQQSILTWKAWNVHAGQYVDLQVMMDKSLTSGVVRQVDHDYKQDLLDKERTDEQQWYAQQRQRARIHTAILVLLIVATGVAAVVGTVSVMRRLRRLRGLADPDTYWREAPAVSPASASKLTDICTLSKEHRSWQIGATMLSLANKGLIALYLGRAAWYSAVENNSGAVSRSNPEINSEANREAASAQSIKDQHTAYLEALQQFQAQHSNLEKKFMFAGSNAKAVTIVLQPASSYASQSGAVQTHDVAAHEANTHREDAGGAEEVVELYESERAVLNLLRTVGSILHTQRFDTKQMSRITRRHLSKSDMQRLSSRASRVNTSIDNEFASLGVARHAGVLTDMMALLAVVSGVGFAVLAAQITGAELVLLGCAGIAWFIGLGLFLLNVRKRVTAHGLQVAQQVLGLRKYLQDFSNFADRDIRSLVLWNEYLVYAVAMGIADTAMKQLMVSFPEELRDPEWLDQYAVGTLLYWLRFQMLGALSVFGSQNTSDQSAQQAWGSGAGAGALGGVDGAQFNVLASAFSGSWNDLGTAVGGSIASLQTTISVASSGFGSQGSSGGSFSGGGFGGVSDGIGGGSFGGR